VNINRTTIYRGGVVSISVAMCTYNGERYLQQQLDSIFSQEYLPEELVICDDGSTDATVSIIERAIKSSPLKIHLIKNVSSLGVTKNFSQCIGLCKGDYIALCDQDDIWKKDRLFDQKNLLSNAETSLGLLKPLLTYADLELVDSFGVSMGTTFFKHGHLRPVEVAAHKTFAVLNIAPGCGMMINRALVNLALPISDDAVMHDWWLALIASVAGEVIFSDSLAVEYRQHKGNLRGSSDNPVNLIKKLSSPISLLKKQKYNYASAVDQFIAAMDVLDMNGIALHDDLRLYRQDLIRGGIYKIFPLLRGDVSRQGLLKSVSYFIGFCLNYKNQSIRSRSPYDP
jgi:glycosyltransferase involved in cell wall biosynthesis